MAKFNYNNYKDRKTFKLLYPLAPIIRLFTYQSTAYQKENIPEKGPYLIACNHVDFFDPGQIALAFDGLPIHYMTKSDPWDKNICPHLLAGLNAFPVKRGTADITSLKYAAELIKQGHQVCIFPEGTRSKTGELGRPKNGVALVARMAHADVLPVSIYYEGELKKGIGNGTRMTVRIGELIPYEKLGLTDDGDTHELKEATGIIWEQVVALHEMGHPVD